MPIRFWLAFIGAAVILVVVLLATAFAHDDAAMSDPQRGDWFKSLKRNDTGGSCCNLTDCQQTQAKQLPDGSWIAVVTGATGAKWRAIPPEKVLTTPLSIDGEAYVCGSKGSNGTWFDQDGRAREGVVADPVIFCFVPPIPGF